MTSPVSVTWLSEALAELAVIILRHVLVLERSYSNLNINLVDCSGFRQEVGTATSLKVIGVERLRRVVGKVKLCR